MEGLQELYTLWSGEAPLKVEPLGLSGSHRRYYRIFGDKGNVIGVTGTDHEENRAFITESAHFHSKGIRVPEVLAISEDGMRYIQQDLGTQTLFDFVRKGRQAGSYSPSELEMLRKAIAGLPKLQFEGAEGLDWSVCYPDREFNARMIDFDLSYFKYCFLKTCRTEFNEIRLQDDFDRLKADLLDCPRDTFMYRDFQARNIMVHNSEPWYIDFQGGRKGPLWYDAASFVYQAGSHFPEEVKAELLETYFNAMRSYSTVTWEEFYSKLRMFVLLRMLQVLGAYGFRGRFEKKEHFLESIPYAAATLKSVLQEPFERYPYLSEVLLSVAEEQLAPLPTGPLTVRVFSFSYKKGIPEDNSGNGGGYVFDCRGLPNPGRYDQYKSMTGMDAPVAAFLESKPEVLAFLDNIRSLVDPHVENYLSRGFTDLQICFGCTGGQHRSVWFAEKIARHLRSKYGIRVRLVHREQKLETELG